MPSATVSTAGMRIVKLLVGREPRTVDDLMRATRVTRTSVGVQLNELVNDGFVERVSERLSGRGRPRHRYSVTQKSLLLLAGYDQQAVVPAMWRAMEEVGGENLVQEILQRVSQFLADCYICRMTTRDPEERFRQLARLFRKEGAIVDIAKKDGLLVLHRRSCPFISMFEEGRSVCAAEQMMMNTVVGCPVKKIKSRHDGHPCCGYAIETNGKRSRRH